MSLEYDKYLKVHRECVIHGGQWILNMIDEKKLNDILPKLHTNTIINMLFIHDSSKFHPVEYDPYDKYFYFNDGSPDIQKDFDYAWLRHIHMNPHHWQYWVLVSDDEGKPKPLDIPDDVIIEMVSDWWSFSWKKRMEDTGTFDDLYEVFDWFDDHKGKMILTESTRLKVEMLLEAIHEELDILKEQHENNF